MKEIKSRFPFQLDYLGQQEVFNSACQGWKTRLANLWGKSILLKETVIITERFYSEMRKACTPEQHQVFDKIFGKDIIDIMDRIKTFEDACEAVGENPTIIFYGTLDEIAHAKLKIIVKALNEGWKPDWNNNNQYKYYPWFDLDGVFRFCGARVCYSVSSVGSRLCFKSAELAEYAATQFIDLYKDFLTA